jgi:NitT/TauT family transport system ATP-binding protein
MLSGSARQESDNEMLDTSSPRSDAIIEFKNVAKFMGGEVIYRDLSFSVCDGEFVCIIGPSGCGKSTTLRLIGGLLSANGGTITVAGQSPEQTWNRLAYVFQSPRLAPWRTALENVLLATELRLGTKTAGEKAKAAELLKLVGLGDAAAKYPYMLSGGERQRVALARALAVHPDIILMDEPFSALDPNTRQNLRVELIEIWRKTRKTIIFVTHDVDEALLLADRILVLSTKPAEVLHTLCLDQERWRNIESDATLRQHRALLLHLFSQAAGERATVMHS